MISLASCGKSYLSITQEPVDARSLASTYIGSPDPRQAHPPLGQMLVVSWAVAPSLIKKHLQIVLKVNYWNYTDATFYYPLNKPVGYLTYSLLNEEFEKKVGLLSYAVQIIGEDGEVYEDWKHQLYTKLIHVGDEERIFEPGEPLREFPVENEVEGVYIEFDEDVKEYPGLEEVTFEKTMSPEERVESAKSKSSSVEGQSIQGSVIETPYFKEEGLSESN